MKFAKKAKRERERERETRYLRDLGREEDHIIVFPELDMYVSLEFIHIKTFLKTRKDC
jgi:hypothetical protein